MIERILTICLMRRPAFRVIAGAVALTAVAGLWALATTCGFIPPPHISRPSVSVEYHLLDNATPPHISRPSVLVEYHLPDNAPDGNGYIFIKTVTQVRTQPHYVTIVFSGYWAIHEVPVWTKAFLCRISREGTDRRVIAEIPVSALGIPPDGFPYRLKAFKIENGGRKAIIFTALDHFVALDLISYKTEVFPTNSFASAIPTGS